MITPFSIFKNMEDIIDLLKDDNKLVLPICESFLFVFNKMLDPSENYFVIFEQNDAP